MRLIVLICLITTASAQLCDLLSSSSEAEISEPCMDQLKIVCNNVSLWGPMLDASSKYPISGMSYSNNRDLGNYDQCIDINYEAFEGNVKGKYCGLSVAFINFFLDGAIPNPWKLEIKPKTLAELPNVNYSSRSLKAATDFSMTLLSVCIPDQCTPREAGKFFLWTKINDILNQSIVNFADTVPCMTKDSNTTFKWGDIVFTTFLAFILFLIAWCTTYDFILQKLKRETQRPVLLAFSLITNGKKLLHVSAANPSQIQCLNGLRFISMMWVIAGHGFVALEEAPLINYAEVDRYRDKVYVQYIGSGPIAVDTFFFLSGFLLCFGYLKATVKLAPVKQALGVPMMILHRYLRLTPALAVLYFACITILRMTGSGPLWDAMATQIREQCERRWWPFFIYVQNYVSFNDMCLNHTWYLSADMQMFILAPIVLIPIVELIKQNKRNWVYIGLCALIVICVIFPMAIRFGDHSIENVYDTHSRLNNYLIGVLLGVIMRDPKFDKFPFHKLVNLGIWCFVLIVCVMFNIIYHNIVRIYIHTTDTLFYGLYRPVWCLSLAWMVYSCHKGYGGPINWFLSLPAFQIGARLSYCMYLLHAVIQFYWVGLIRTPYFWGDYMNFYNFCGHFVVTLIMSGVWTLAFESPMIAIEKFIFGGGGRKQKGEARA